MKRVFRLGLALLVLLGLGAGGYWFYQNQIAVQGSSTATDGYTQVVTAQRGNLTASLTVVGELEAVQHETLTFERLAGKTVLKSLAVQAGNTVTVGQVLATIDPAPYKQVLDQARSDLQAAEEKLADLKTPATALEIAQADLKVARAELQLEQAKDTLNDLVNLNIADLQSAVVSARSDLAKTQSDLVALQTDRTTEDKLTKLRDTEATAASEYARLAAETYSDVYYQDRLQLAYNKMMDAQDARVTAEIQQQVNLLQAQMKVTKAKQSLVDAEEALAEAKAGGDALALAKAQLAVRDAEVALAAAKEDRAGLDKGTDATTLAAAQADLDKKRLAVTEAEEDLAATSLVAPFEGTVLQTHTAAGSNIAANSSIVTLANLKGLQVVASVDETTIRQVSVGQKAQISFDAFPGQTFRGEVLEVPLQGTLQGNVMVYEVLVSLVGAEKLPLLVGMTANVQISMGSVENGLLVPTMALQKVGGMYQVLVPNATDPEGEPELVPVEVGLSTGTYTQIVKGLNEGDKVVMRISATQSNPFFRGGGGQSQGVVIGR
ncbi:MAG: efflux RND transporter periplasmic adaptor subunit [Anaerolineae bacterium]|nr:efflux RND transporter periplasmic adaptor subunit [Anaerolineae bacterium]